MEIGGRSICFFDLKIIVVNGKLKTTAYSKSSALQSYLQANSSHKSSSIIIGIQKGVQIKSIGIKTVPSIKEKVIEKLLITLLQRLLR